MNKKIFLIIGVCVMLALAVMAWQYRSTPQVQYMTETAKISTIENTVLAGGVVNAVELVDVGAQATGRVEKLYVSLGQSVKTGDVIADIEATGQLAALQEEELNYQNLQAQHKTRISQLALAKSEHESQKILYDNGLLSRMDYLKSSNALKVADNELKSSQLQLEQAKLKIRTAKNNLNYTHITAPMDGVVAAIVTKQGQTVNAAQSAPTIIRLAQIDSVYIKAKFSEVDVPRLKIGMPAYFGILGMPNRRFETVLESLELLPVNAQSDSTSQSAVYYTGLLSVPNPNHELYVGMTANVQIITQAKTDVLAIPITALGEKMGDNVYKVEIMPKNTKNSPFGTAALPTTKEIEIGLQNDTLAEVISGLAEGDEVVISQSTGEVQTLSSEEFGM
ncbi:MAG: efflux RND transporter periplasmic adaptor subunit [Moraxella sp.]|nr:efflux RND transporter periplasmic adaptor subunit [Moraxella sp.]